jgi:hypothetical protein
MAVRNPRDTRIRLEEEAMPGSTVEATQEAERRAVSGRNIVPSAKEVAKMPKKVAKDVISRATTVLSQRVEDTFNKAMADLEALENQRLADNAAFDKAMADADILAKEAEAAAAEGDRLKKEAEDMLAAAIDAGIISYSSASDPMKDLINKLPQFSDAGLAAARAALQAVGVEGLLGVMEDIRKLYPGINSEDALNLLKFDKRFNAPYLQRFAGNKMLQDAGFRMLDDKEYLATEAAFDKIFTSYGLKQFSNREKYANLIGRMVSADELAARVSTAYDRVIKGASETKQALNRLFPELNDSDILAYALDPVNQLPAIQRKVQAAEIGGAALAQNLSIGLQAAPAQATGFTNVRREGLGIEELQAQGIDLKRAREGFAAVAEVLPAAETLSARYGDRMAQYTRKEAEQEAFMDLASAKRARRKLSETEIAQFQGQSGVGRLGKSVGGQI